MRIPIAVLVLLSSISAIMTPAPVRAEQALCRPGPAVEEVLDAIGPPADLLDLSPEEWRAKRDLAEGALEEHPDDLFLHRRLQDVYRFGPKTEREERLPDLRRWYEELRREHPDDGRYHYLFGRIVDDPDAERQAQEAAVEASPDLPWGHLALASVSLRGVLESRRTGDGEDPEVHEERARTHLLRFMELCPDRIREMLSFSGAIDDPSFWQRRIPAFRERLREAPAEHLRTFPSLWSLEFRVADPAEHEAVRGRVAADLAVLEDLDRDRSGVLDVLKEGYELAGKTDRAAALEAELRKASPCSMTSIYATLEDWGREQMVADPQAFAETTGEWVERCPDSYLFRIYHFRALDQLEGAAPEEIVAAGERAAALYGDWPGYSIPSGYEQVARIFVDRGLALDRVDELLDRAEAEAAERREDRPLEDFPESERGEAERRRKEADLRRDLLRARARATRGEVQSARDLLDDVRGRLDGLEPGEDTENSVRLRHRGSESIYWQARAELAEAEDRSADAVACWVRAASVRPADPPVWLDGPSRDTAHERAMELWTGLGGTEAGLAALEGAAADASVGEAELAEYSPWEETEGALPPFELTDLSGDVWTSEDLEGKTVFVNAWATWCGPCRLELPAVQELHERFEERDDVLVVTLNMDDNPGVVAPYMDKEGFGFPVLLATDFLQEEMEVFGIPRSWIVDPTLQRRFVQEGYDPSVEEEAWLAEVEGLVGEVAR